MKLHFLVLALLLVGCLSDSKKDAPENNSTEIVNEQAPAQEAPAEDMQESENLAEEVGEQQPSGMEAEGETPDEGMDQEESQN